MARIRASDADRHVGARMRERRVMLGLTQQAMSDLIGVTCQQAHKYEKGVNRVSAGRLHTIAQALGVDVGYFFEGLDGAAHATLMTSSQRMVLELSKNFLSLDRGHQEAVCALARKMAEPNGTEGA